MQIEPDSSASGRLERQQSGASRLSANKMAGQPARHARDDDKLTVALLVGVASRKGEAPLCSLGSSSFVVYETHLPPAAEWLVRATRSERLGRPNYHAGATGKSLRWQLHCSWRRLIWRSRSEKNKGSPLCSLVVAASFLRV